MVVGYRPKLLNSGKFLYSAMLILSMGQGTQLLGCFPFENRSPHNAESDPDIINKRPVAKKEAMPTNFLQLPLGLPKIKGGL